MKVKKAIEQLQELNPDSELLVSTGDTFEDASDFTLSYGGPTSSDGETKTDTKFVYININDNKETKITI